MSENLSPPVLKKHVDELGLGDYVLVQDEFGEFLLGQIDRVSPLGRNIRAGDWYFSKKTGAQLSRLEEYRGVVVGRYLPDKRIHLGNGVLFTEEQRYEHFRKRHTARDRRKLISQIKQATLSDWLLFTDKELVEIADRLGRLETLELKVISTQTEEIDDAEENTS